MCVPLTDDVICSHDLYVGVDGWGAGGWVCLWGGGGIDFCEWSSETPTFRVTATVSLLLVLFQETEHGAEKVGGQWGGIEMF